MITQAEIEAAAEAILECRCRADWFDTDGDGHWKHSHDSEMAKAALEAAARVRWQPIETVPTGIPILLFCAKDGATWIATRDADFIGWYGVDDKGRGRTWATHDPTHWQPLPSPPENQP